MKKTIIAILTILGICSAASAQEPVNTAPAATPSTSFTIPGAPGAVGARIGAMGIDGVYIHSLNSTQFIEANVGLDFGYNATGTPGFKLSALYNYIWARPAWTDTGRWALYAGAGLSMGYVDDFVSLKGEIPEILQENFITGSYDTGFMIAAAIQVGISYTFDFPLQLAIDLRPYLGIHSNDGKIRIGAGEYDLGGKTEFYDNGLLGFVPSVSARYAF